MFIESFSSSIQRLILSMRFHIYRIHESSDVYNDKRSSVVDRFYVYVNNISLYIRSTHVINTLTFPARKYMNFSWKHGMKRAIHNFDGHSFNSSQSIRRIFNSSYDWLTHHMNLFVIYIFLLLEAETESESNSKFEKVDPTESSRIQTESKRIPLD